jgi:hypothetical protein
MIDERRAELKRLEESYDRAEQIEQAILDMRADLARAERKRDAFAAHGNKHIEVPHPVTRHEALGLEFELEPFRSVLTGKQLAEQVQAGEIDPIAAELRRLEAERKSLLSKAERN